jgi:transcriptional regulator with XRE-family HTH domain
MPWNSGNPLYIGYTFCGHPFPFCYRTASKPQAMSNFGQKTPLRTKKLHTELIHSERLPQGSVRGKRNRLPPVQTRAAISFSMEIGGRIKRARMAAGLSQRELADAAQVSPGLVGQWESHRKKPGRENLIAIARATTVSVGYLVGHEEFNEQTVTTSNPMEVALLRKFRRLNSVQRKNIAQLLDISVDIRQEIEKQRSPAQAE